LSIQIVFIYLVLSIQIVFIYLVLVHPDSDNVFIPWSQSLSCLSVMDACLYPMLSLFYLALFIKIVNICLAPDFGILICHIFQER
jgi:hypothetical protein